MFKTIFSSIAFVMMTACAVSSESELETSHASFSIEADAPAESTTLNPPENIEEAERTCTKVQRACGTCPGGAIVEWYCDGGGNGSDPDFRTCESCEPEFDGSEIRMSAAPSCEGNACNDITIHFRSGCYYVKNYSSRRVRVRLGHVARTLQREETWRVVIFNQCLKAYRAPAKANYAS